MYNIIFVRSKCHMNKNEEENGLSYSLVSDDRNRLHFMHSFNTHLLLYILEYINKEEKKNQSEKKKKKNSEKYGVAVVVPFIQLCHMEIIDLIRNGNFSMIFYCCFLYDTASLLQLSLHRHKSVFI